MEDLLPIEERFEMQVVSSVVLADRLDIQHKNVLELIKKHLPTIEKTFGRVTVETQPFETNGGWQSRNLTYLTEDQAMFVCTLSRNTDKVVEVKAAIVKSFQAARRAILSFVMPQTFAEALQLAANQAKQLEEQQKQLVEAQPKVEMFDKLMDSGENLTVAQFAKIVGVGPIKMFDLLRENKILMYGGTRHNQPFQEYLQRGYFIVKETVVGPKTSPKAHIQTFITPKGQEWLAKRFV